MKTTFTLAGNIASLKHFPASNGKKSVTKVSVAHNYQVRGESRAEFFPLTAFESTAEFLNNHFKVGSPVIVTVTPTMGQSQESKWLVPEFTVAHVDFAPSSKQ
jgi:single-stranded DNA-binding protein